MKLFLDENMPLTLVSVLKEFVVAHASSEGLKGASDAEIARYAKENKAVLITRDLEFGNTLLYPKGAHFGLIIVRLPHFAKADKIAQVLRTFLKKMPPEKLIGKIAVLEIGRYRIRNIASTGTAQSESKAR